VRDACDAMGMKLARISGTVKGALGTIDTSHPEWSFAYADVCNRLGADAIEISRLRAEVERLTPLAVAYEAIKLDYVTLKNEAVNKRAS
jgi:hypothetical protein